MELVPRKGEVALAKKIKAVIRSKVVATAYITQDKEGNIKIEKVLDVLSYKTDYIRKF